MPPAETEQDTRKYTVIGAYISSVRRLDENRTSRRSHAGVDDRQVYGVPWEISADGCKDKGSMPDVLRRYLVANVDQSHSGGQTEDDTLHRRHETVAVTKIRS